MHDVLVFKQDLCCGFQYYTCIKSVSAFENLSDFGSVQGRYQVRYSFFWYRISTSLKIMITGCHVEQGHMFLRFERAHAHMHTHVQSTGQQRELYITLFSVESFTLSMGCEQSKPVIHSNAHTLYAILQKHT